ncbi:hypothetical protein EDD16DRAFT_521522 [Pisolithus croceorrhizus]|nr:hypothetical protein EDD16DRAFT_521522 [Pisolithus croceorrhizus]
MSPPNYAKYPELYIDTVMFLVENTLFRVPRKPLEEESAVFKDMFLLPQPDDDVVEGQDDTRPVILHGVSKGDFECLLKVLLCRQHGQNKGLALSLADEWISVLKLSTMWEFASLRTAAVRGLEANVASPCRLDLIEKVVFATRYDIKEWLLPSLLAIARRPNPISVEEGRRLGIETALKLASVREKLRLQGHTRLVVGDRDPSAASLDFTPVIRKVFEIQSPREPDVFTYPVI